MRTALRLLRATNPIVRHTLTCFKRELTGKEFPAGAGGPSGIPSMPKHVAAFQTGIGTSSDESADEGAESPGAREDDPGADHNVSRLRGTRSLHESADA